MYSLATSIDDRDEGPWLDRDILPYELQHAQLHQARVAQTLFF